MTEFPRPIPQAGSGNDDDIEGTDPSVEQERVRQSNRARPTTETECLDHFRQLDENVSLLQAALQSISVATIAMHKDAGQGALQAKAGDPEYRFKRLSQFVRTAKERIEIDGLDQTVIELAAGLAFQRTWEVILKAGNDGVDPDIGDRLSRLKEVPPIPKEPAATFDRKHDGDVLDFVRRNYGVWLEAELLDYDTFLAIDAKLAKRADKRLSYIGKGRNDLFTPAWLAAENRELHTQGFLSPETLRRRQAREHMRERRNSV